MIRSMVPFVDLYLLAVVERDGRDDGGESETARVDSHSQSCSQLGKLDHFQVEKLLKEFLDVRS